MDNDVNRALENAQGHAQAMLSRYEAAQFLEDEDDDDFAALSNDAQALLKEYGYGDDSDDDVAERIAEGATEDALSIEVRTVWFPVGRYKPELGEFRILLTCGGPTLWLLGELDDANRPTDAVLVYQDIGVELTEYKPASETEREAIAWFADQFWFGGY